MSDFTPAANRVEQALNKYRVAFAIAGLGAIVAGLLILLWPSAVMSVIAIIIGAYAIIAGVIFLGLGIFGKEQSTSSQIGRILLGAVLLVIGILAFVYMNTTTNILIMVLGFSVGALWLAQGIVTLMVAVRDSNTNPWTIAFSILAIGAGILSMFTPMFGFTFLRWLFGLSFVILGSWQVVRAIQMGQVEKTVRQSAKQAKDDLIIELDETP